MKFFPAGPAGGPDYLAAIGAPIPQVQFCPTGGVSLDSAPGYLALAECLLRGRQLAYPARSRRKRGLGSRSPGSHGKLPDSAGTKSTAAVRASKYRTAKAMAKDWGES